MGNQQETATARKTEYDLLRPKIDQFLASSNSDDNLIPHDVALCTDRLRIDHTGRLRRELNEKGYETVMFVQTNGMSFVVVCKQLRNRTDVHKIFPILAPVQ